MTDPAFTVRGGARIGGQGKAGGWNYTWPFAKLEATEARVRISVPGRDHVFERSSRIRRFKGFFSLGVELRSAEWAPRVVFWPPPLGYRALVNALTRLGYTVE